MEHQIPDIVRQAVLKRRVELVSEREQLVRDIDRQIAEIDSFLKPPFGDAPIWEGATNLESEVDSDASITRHILEMAKATIVPGERVTTKQLATMLLAAGVKFPLTGKAPEARITRVLSGSKLYKGHKTLGWALKGESSGATELSNAAKSTTDTE